MKTIAKTAAIMLTLGILFACGGENTPEQTALSFYESLHKRDVKKTESLVTKESVPMLSFLQAMMEEQIKDEAEKARIEEATFKVSKSEISNDSAKVWIDIQYQDKVETEKVNLAKVDGKWKVILGK